MEEIENNNLKSFPKRWESNYNTVKGLDNGGLALIKKERLKSLKCLKKTRLKSLKKIKVRGHSS